jgi:hypothetical protein
VELSDHKLRGFEYVNHTNPYVLFANQFWSSTTSTKSLILSIIFISLFIALGFFFRLDNLDYKIPISIF